MDTTTNTRDEAHLLFEPQDEPNIISRSTPTHKFDLDAEIDRQRALGYETFDDYIARTGFPRDEASYAAFIGEGHWMICSNDKP